MASAELLKQGDMRRKAILGFVRAYTGRKGWAPTIQEIAEGVGLNSPNSTRGHLQRLADEGYLRIELRQARAIACVDPAPDGWTRKAAA